jgi:hypothetical protein
MQFRNVLGDLGGDIVQKTKKRREDRLAGGVANAAQAYTLVGCELNEAIYRIGWQFGSPALSGDLLALTAEGYFPDPASPA